mmetsp:Transcript_38631/g.78794  ORF Transcript_38631/g.78794 Transcript_38631/m.78794 type:complete len:290 (+) Transcript_38631:224-1093(+)
MGIIFSHPPQTTFILRRNRKKIEGGVCAAGSAVVAISVLARPPESFVWEGQNPLEMPPDLLLSLPPYGKDIYPKFWFNNRARRRVAEVSITPCINRQPDLPKRPVPLHPPNVCLAQPIRGVHLHEPRPIKRREGPLQVVVRHHVPPPPGVERPHSPTRHLGPVPAHGDLLPEGRNRGGRVPGAACQAARRYVPQMSELGVYSRQSVAGEGRRSGRKGATFRYGIFSIAFVFFVGEARCHVLGIVEMDAHAHQDVAAVKGHHTTLLSRRRRGLLILVGPACLGLSSGVDG